MFLYFIVEPITGALKRRFQRVSVSGCPHEFAQKRGPCYIVTACMGTALANGCMTEGGRGGGRRSAKDKNTSLDMTDGWKRGSRMREVRQYTITFNNEGAITGHLAVVLLYTTQKLSGLIPLPSQANLCF